METLNIVMLDIPFMGIATIAIISLIVFLGLRDVSSTLKKEKESFLNPKLLSLSDAGMHFQVIVIDGDKIQLRMLVEKGSANLPLSYEMQQEISIYLPDIDPGPDYWYESSNINMQIRHYGKIFQVINNNGELDFKTFN